MKKWQKWEKKKGRLKSQLLNVFFSCGLSKSSAHPAPLRIPETWILGRDSRRVLCHASSDVGCDAGWGTGRVNDGPWGHFWLSQRERCKTASSAELTTEVDNRRRTYACTHTKLSKRMCQAKAQGERSCEIQIRCDCVRYWKKAVLAWRLLSCCDKHLFVEHEISVVAHWISAGFDNYTNRKKTSTCRPMRKIEVKVSTKRQNIQNIEASTPCGQQMKSDKLFDASTSKKRKERNTGVTKAWQMFRACMYPLHKTNWSNETWPAGSLDLCGSRVFCMFLLFCVCWFFFDDSLFSHFVAFCTICGFFFSKSFLFLFLGGPFQQAPEEGVSVLIFFIFSIIFCIFFDFFFLKFCSFLKCLWFFPRRGPEGEGRLFQNL